MVGANHETSNIFTYPYKVKILGYEKESISKGDIVVEDDVWIGFILIIMPGVKIGQGAIFSTG